MDQAEPDPAKAVRLAAAANDHLRRRFVEPHPTRFAGFAAVALQEPEIEEGAFVLKESAPGVSSRR